MVTDSSCHFLCKIIVKKNFFKGRYEGHKGGLMSESKAMQGSDILCMKKHSRILTVTVTEYQPQVLPVGILDSLLLGIGVGINPE